ncbi:MAG: hypothetical protein DRQ62_09750, partial [Gammaproteobacteria bacterium]
CLNNDCDVLLGDIIINPRNRDHDLELMPIVIESQGEQTILPTKDHKIKEGDQLLFCGTATARQLLKANINNEYTLHYLRTGRFKPASYFAQWYTRRFNNV